MITPKYTNIFIRIGADFLQEFVINDFNNLPIDLTGASISASFSNSTLPYDAINCPLVHVSNFVAQIDSALDGKISISSPNSATSTYKFGRYFYQVNITLSGKIYRAYEGILTINP